MNSQELYAQELKQSDVDHHKPTAGAMTGHITSNLLIHALKISQARFFAKGNASLFLDRYAPAWLKYETTEFNELNRLLTNNGESIPTTTDQFKEFSMLEEDGASKYDRGNDQLFALVKDFDTQTLFITKAISLAQKEGLLELANNLTTLLDWIKEQIATTQRFLGHNIREGLYNEEEEDDDDFQEALLMAEELCVQLVPLFQKLDLEKQRKIEQLVHHQYVKAHELIITPDSEHQLVIVAHGAVKMYSLDLNGNEMIVRALNSGDFVGDTWLLGTNNHNYFIEAVDNSEICTINQSDFLTLLKNSSEITATLLKEQAEQISLLRKQAQLLSIVNIGERITTYLSQLRQTQGKASVELPFALKDVASYLGTTPETLTRKLKLLEKHGKIEYHLRKIKIKDKL